MTDFDQLNNNSSNENESKIIQMDASSAEVVGAHEKANLEIQLETARRFPRDIKKCLQDMKLLATLDKDVAESCFYAIRRGDKTITGASVRFAEIVVATWKNLRVWSIIMGYDGKHVTAKGYAYDLETNTIISQEVKRRHTDRHGRMASDDMLTVHSNAVSAIALRNVILKIVPTVLTKHVQDAIKESVVGTKETFNKTRDKAIKYFTDNGITEKQILKLFESNEITDLTPDDVFILRGMVNAVKDKDITLAEQFDTHTKSTKVNSSFSEAPPSDNKE